MADTPTTAEKLGIKASQRLLILNAPAGMIERLGPLPESAALIEPGGERADFVLLFVHNKAEIDNLAPEAAAALRPRGLLWFAYPKKTGSIKTDINRDRGWDTVLGLGLNGVRQIAIDDTWSALRFRPAEDIRRRGDAG